VTRLSNTLVIVLSAENAMPFPSAASLTNPAIRRIALAEPKTVPAGVYAREFLVAQKLWSAVEPKVIPTANVRAALAAVESGNVEAAIVYQTDARISKKVRVAHEVPARRRSAHPLSRRTDPGRAQCRGRRTVPPVPQLARSRSRIRALWIHRAALSMTANEWQIVWFTAWVSALSTLLILPFGLATAWLLARKDWPGKSICETLVALPLVMPPVATGLILLKLLGRRGTIGSFLHDTLGLDVVFTWRAVLIALGVMSFPLLVRSARVAFEEVNPRLEQIARTLGAGEWRVFLTITAPLAALAASPPDCSSPLRARSGNSARRSWSPGTSPARPRRSLSRSFNRWNWARMSTRWVCSRFPPDWRSSRCGSANISSAIGAAHDAQASKHFAATRGLRPGARRGMSPARDGHLRSVRRGQDVVARTHRGFAPAGVRADHARHHGADRHEIPDDPARA
jgi:ABC-type tungstate transport system substrate-binding protein